MNENHEAWKARTAAHYAAEQSAPATESVAATPSRSNSAGSGPIKTVLALDLGTTTGYALRMPSGRIVSGVASFKPGRFDGGGMRFVRFVRFLQEMLASTPIGAVYFEEVRRHLGVDAAHIYGGLMAHLTAWCEAKNIPYSGVPVGTIKKHATGKGNASKDEMIAAVKARGHAPADDNEADALALLYQAIEGGA
jgi:hypothetical protein